MEAPVQLTVGVATHEMFAMCAEGWGVIYCNPRGSEGRGGDFADIRQKWGTVDYRDLMEFTDAAIERFPWIDKERLGITGGSYGGIIINWILGHTGRYKAAILTGVYPTSSATTACLT